MVDAITLVHIGVFLLFYLMSFPFTIIPPAASIHKIFKCHCRHKRKHHIMKITGYDIFKGIKCIKVCRVCNSLCDGEGIKTPWKDMRKQYLPKFKEMEYETEHPRIRKPLSRIINKL